MSRKGRKATKRQLNPDPRYGDALATKFINNLMKQGKKTVAQRFFYQALDAVGKKVPDMEPLDVFREALGNVQPGVEVKSRRVGGANYQIPIEVAPERARALAIRWVLEAVRSRNEKTLDVRLANELVDAFNRTGGAVKKREDTHRMADANKAFAHYRW